PNLMVWHDALLYTSALLVPMLALTFFLREPARTQTLEPEYPVRHAWPRLWRLRSIALPLQLARSTLLIADGAVVVWGGPLFARVYHWPTDRMGSLMSLELLVGGVLGALLGGPLVDFCQRRGGARFAITVMGVVALISTPAAFFPMMNDANFAAWLLGIILIL